MAPSGQVGRDRVWLQDAGGEDRGKGARLRRGKQGSLGKQLRGLHEASLAENQRPGPTRGKICNSDAQGHTWLVTGFVNR